MHLRRLTAAAAAGLALAGVAGCRTAPNVAAYVGDDQLTVTELQSAVDDRLRDPAIEQFASGDRENFTRLVLTRLVQDEVHDAAAERYGVEVTDAQVQQRLGEIFEGQDEDEAYAGLAQQGLSRQDAFSLVRQQLIRLGIAEEEGLADALSDDALRERYDQTVNDANQVEFGYITVPDQRTADRVVDALNADPDRYEALAERYAGTYTIGALQSRTLDEIPTPLAQQAADAEPGTAFSVPIEETGGIVVGFVGPAPSFEELRPQLEQEAQGEVVQAANPVIDDVRDDLDVVVNPRYGDLQDGEVQPADGGVVSILTEG